MLTMDPDKHLDLAREQLVEEHAGRVTPAAVRRAFDAEVARYATAPIRTFLPVLVPRQVRRVLAVQA